MSKLNNHGSSLVISVVVTTIIAILSLSILHVVGYTVRNETTNLKEAKAFWAAESGIQIGARWLRGQPLFPTIIDTIIPFTTPLLINDLEVTVKLIPYTDSLGTTVVTIIAETYDGSTHNSNTFLKRIIWETTQAEYGMYTTFFNSIFGHTGDNHGGWLGFYRRTFNGRFHMNTFIEIYSGSRPGNGNDVIFRDGLVTVATDSGYNYGLGGHHNNNYNHGVEIGWTNLDSASRVAELDTIFQNEFQGDAEKIDIPDSLTASLLNNHANKISLPTSEDDGDEYDDYRPTLEFTFNGTTPVAKYHYKEGSDYKTQEYENYDDSIFISSQNLNILGEVKGNTTVATTYGKSIVPVDDLIYKDYDTINKTVSASSSNVVGLVSGKYLKFNHQWKKQWQGTADTMKNITGGNDTIDMNASVIAVEANGTTWQGTEYWDRSRPINYSLHLTGNHILGAWRAPSTSSGNGCTGFITINHDERLKREKIPIGYPNVYTSNGLLVLQFEDWEEGNTY